MFWPISLGAPLTAVLTIGDTDYGVFLPIVLMQ
jgi:hypothetical protein